MTTSKINNRKPEKEVKGNDQRLLRVIPQKGLVLLSVVVAVALVLPAFACAPEEEAPSEEAAPEPTVETVAPEEEAPPEEAAPEPTVETVEVRIHSQTRVGSYVTECVDLFIDEAEARSDGTLEFTHYPAQQLYTDKAMANVLPEGGVEMAQINALVFFGEVPEVVGMCLPGFYKDQDHWFRVNYDIDHGGGYGEEVLVPAFREKANVELLGTLQYAPNTCSLTNKPVYEIQDYEGLKMRTYAATLSALVKAIGASPVVMSSPDVYMALERGTVDGAFSALASFYSRHWYEAAKYVQEYYTFATNFNLAANLDFWNSLAPSQQKAIVEAALIAEINCIEKAIEAEGVAREGLIAEGVEVFDFPPSEARKVRELARPGLVELANGLLGEELASTLVTMIDDTRDVPTTWRESCEQANERALAAIE